jgi:hypothetical protein
LHRTTEHTDFSVELLRYIKNDLDTMNRGRKRSDNDAALRFGKDLFEGRDDGAF